MSRTISASRGQDKGGRQESAKALVPLVFVYLPSMLLVVDNFTWNQFLIAFSGCTIGVMLLGASLAGYFLAPIPSLQRWIMGAAARTGHRRRRCGG